jgi:hypothetical protein
VDELARRFADFARAFEVGAPLYGRIAARVSREPRVLDLMSVTPETQRIPVLLFASAHHLLLAEPNHPLADHYPNFERANAEGDATDHFVDFVLSRSEPMRELLATRSTQTNEIGRCNWFLFPLSMLNDEVGTLARVDIGSSAGLTLLAPLIDYDVRPGGLIGSGSTLTIGCDVRGEPPLPSRPPDVVRSLGIDASPIDVRDDDQVRWLEACAWPDQVERFARLRSAITLARVHDIRVEKGDAVDDVVGAIERVREHGHPVVTTSWVLNYLSPARRTQFVNALDRVGASTDLSWIIAESPRETPELPGHAGKDEDITVISLVTWRQGVRRVERLATTHPHGNWVNWGA